MKKSIVTLTLTISSLMFSQTKELLSSIITYGVKGGLNISLLKGKSEEGLYGGIFLNVPVSSKINIQPEILYNRISAEGIGTSLNSNEDFDSSKKLSLGYISTLIMIKYYIFPVFYFEAGPQISFLLGSSKTYPSISTIDTKVLKFRSVDFALAIGASYYFTPNIAAILRFVKGLGNIFIGGPTNDVIQMGLAYKF